MLYFMSDPHFYHENIIKFCKRPFKDVQEMNTMLLKNINDTVGQKDELWILGDFCFAGWSEAAAILRQINCKNIHYVDGNHDKPMRHENVRKLLKSYQDYKTISYEGQQIVMFHYPIADWVAAHRGAWMVHGHTHGTLPPENMGLANKKIVDIGVDCWQYKPVSFIELKAYMDKREKVVYGYENNKM